MNAVLNLFNEPWLQAIGYTLLHSLWQSFLVAVAVIIFLKMIPGKFSNARYAIASIGLLLILSCSIGTFIYLYSASKEVTFTATVAGKSDLAISTAASTTVPKVVAYFTQARYFIQSSIPSFLMIWVVGAFLFSLRLLTGLWYVEKLKSSSMLLNNEWNQHIQVLAQRLKIKRLVLLAESSVIQAPIVVGYIKPLILIPIGMCSSLSTEQLETIFLHEMMHIRRKDYLVNLLQIGVEAVYFFNPFVWLISGIMKREREHCCDDAVVQLHGSATEYAHALATLEELRLTKAGVALSLAENKNQLLNRIKRLMEKSVKNYSGRERIVPALLLIIGLICASWISAQTRTGDSEMYENTVVAADTIKKEKKTQRKKAEVAKENAVSPEEEKSEIERENEEDLSLYPVPPIPDFELVIPPIPYIEPMPALPPQELSLMMEDFEGHEFFLKNGEDWEAFSKEFEENFKSKFGDFYEKHEKDIQKMMEDAQEKINSKFDKDWEMKMQGFASEMGETDVSSLYRNISFLNRRQEELMSEQNENFTKSAEEFRRSAEDDARKSMEDLEVQRARQHIDFEKSLLDFEMKMKPLEERRKRLEEIKSELIKDGYLGIDEKLEIRWDNGSLRINGKEIKPEDQKKYNDLLPGLHCSVLGKGC